MLERTSQFKGVELRHYLVDTDNIGGEFASNKISKNHSLKAYAYGASDIQEDSIDILVIDGRARIGCLRTNLNKVKKDGIVLFDNSDRVVYQSGIQEILKGWERIDFYGVTVNEYYFTQTSIFKRKV